MLESCRFLIAVVGGGSAGLVAVGPKVRQAGTVMLDLRLLMDSDETMASTNALLLHTVGGLAEAAVAVILVRALYLLRRNGESPQGFVPIAVLMSFGSLARIVRLILSWITAKPPYWLDAVTISLLLFTVLSAPVILSVHYLSVQNVGGLKRHRTGWVRWAMVANATGTFVGFVIALFLGAKRFAPPIAAVGCIVSAALLWIRASLFRNLQIRQRGLMLFSVLTTAGLIGISADLLSEPWDNRPIFASAASSANIETCNMLVVLGMIFVFANLRLADVIVKRVLALYICAVVTLLVWMSVTASFEAGISTDLNNRAGTALLSIALLAGAIALTPMVIRRANAWIDGWVFQAPDFHALLHALWDDLLILESKAEVCREGEAIMKKTLSLAAVRIVQDMDFPVHDGVRLPGGPNPHFLPPQSPFASVTSPPADVVMPLFQEGAPEYWIALSRGVMRPPLTVSELSFVTTVGTQIQVRMATLLAEERRLERLKRESALREQVADAELRALRAQINPHFLFNSLNTIADLAVVAPQKAEEMTVRLAAVFRYVLVNTDRQFSSIREEIHFAKSYLDIEEARFGARLRVRFEIDESVLHETIPTLLLQPLIENAIKHGISPKRAGGSVIITARRNPKGFELTVADDGVGLGAPPHADRDSTHVGLENVRRRLHSAYAEAATFSLRQRAGGGTEATIAIQTEAEG